MSVVDAGIVVLFFLCICNLRQMSENTVAASLSPTVVEFEEAGCYLKHSFSFHNLSRHVYSVMYANDMLSSLKINALVLFLLNNTLILKGHHHCPFPSTFTKKKINKSEKNTCVSHLVLAKKKKQKQKRKTGVYIYKIKQMSSWCFFLNGCIKVNIYSWSKLSCTVSG